MKKIIAILIIFIIAVFSGMYLAYIFKPEIPYQVKNREAISIFKDRNQTHLNVAIKNGIIPLDCRKEVENVQSQLKHIETNDFYKVDKLTHSVPYLTEGARELLTLIAKNFQDSLQSKGYEKHRIIVTSLLRTRNDVTRLQKSGNKNATTHSAHMYATTFDITYTRFDRMLTTSTITKKRPNQRAMHKILAEVLKDLKYQRKCYIMYELRQRCFHITSRI